MKLTGKVAVIAAGASGIGAAIARLFAREGANLALIDIDVAKGMQTCGETQAAGGTCGCTTRTSPAVCKWLGLRP